MLPYLWAVALVCAGIALRSLIAPNLGTALSFITLFPAVFAAAVLGGWGPGIVATVLSAALGRYLFMSPLYSLALVDGVSRLGVALFTVSGIATSWLAEARVQTERRLRDAVGAAERASALAEEESVRAEEEAARAEEEQLRAEEQFLRAEEEAARAEQEARNAARSLGELHATLDTIHDGFLKLNRNFVVTYMNEQAARMAGGQPADFLGRSYWETVPGSYDSAFGRAYRQAVAERRVVRVADEFERLRRAFQVSAYPTDDGLTVVLSEITELLAASRTLRSTEERLTLAQSAAGLGLWEFDASTGRTHYGPEWYGLFGVTRDTAPPTYESWLAGCVHPEDRDQVARAVDAAMQGRRPYEVEFRVVRPDGQVRWMAGRGQVLRDQKGAPLRMIGVHFDVTARREAEERARNAERLEVLGRLAGGVAHEANNQMTVVLGAAAFVLKQTELPDNVREDLRQIQFAAERTADITRQLLAFSRQQMLRPALFDLDDAVRGLESVLRRTLGAGSSLTLRLAAPTARVNADPGQFAQVLLNLTLNAADAMPFGGMLTIETRAIDLTTGDWHLHPGVTVKPGLYGLMSVTDTGIGMSQATLQRIFEPFFTTKPVGKGTGLGLATVYGIVKQSGGYIWAYSEPNRGTAFKIYLPLSAEAPPAEASPAMVARGSGQTVLVVDDEAAVRGIAGRALREHGFHVIEAADGAQALEAVAQADGALHLALVDVVMPGMDGPELARRLGELRPDLPVVMMSGFTDDETLHRPAPADRGFIAKPFSPAALAQQVVQVLSNA